MNAQGNEIPVILSTDEGVFEIEIAVVQAEIRCCRFGSIIKGTDST